MDKISPESPSDWIREYEYHMLKKNTWCNSPHTLLPDVTTTRLKCISIDTRRHLLLKVNEIGYFPRICR